MTQPITLPESIPVYSETYKIVPPSLKNLLTGKRPGIYEKKGGSFEKMQNEGEFFEKFTGCNYFNHPLTKELRNYLNVLIEEHTDLEKYGLYRLKNYEEIVKYTVKEGNRLGLTDDEITGILNKLLEAIQKHDDQTTEIVLKTQRLRAAYQPYSQVLMSAYQRLTNALVQEATLKLSPVRLTRNP